MTRDEILNTRNDSLTALCKLSRNLGYKDPFHQLMNSDGSVVGDLLELLVDNPGCVSAMIDWLADFYGTEEDQCEDCDELLSECVCNNEEDK